MPALRARSPNPPDRPGRGAFSHAGSSAAQTRGFFPAPRPSRGAFSPAGGSAAQTRGFTLLEIMMVVVLIGVITAMTVGLLGVGRSGRQLREAVRTVSTELKYTRTRALVTGQSQVFAMDLDHRAWTASDHHGTLSATLRITVDAVREEQSGSRELAIRFFPDGSSTGGRVSLRVQGVGTRVDVRWLTGEVSQEHLPDQPP